MDAPEGFDSEVFGGCRVADNANDPAVDLALMPSEQRLEGIEVSVTELPQHVGWLFQHWHFLPFYIHLRRGEDVRLQGICYRTSPKCARRVGRHYGFVVVELVEGSLDPTDACEFDFF